MCVCCAGVSPCGAVLMLCCFQTDDKMKYYENLAEMYVGDDVSPDFYGWVFPKYDHVAVGTGACREKGGNVGW